jgi:hypothetical protein
VGNRDRSTEHRQVWRPLACLALLLCGLILPGTARAAIDLESVRFSSTEADGSPSELAGAHPDRVTTSFVFASHDEGQGLVPIESPRNLTVDLPPGMVGNPAALPTCSHRDLEAEEDIECPPETEIGYVEAIIPGVGGGTSLKYPMYNLEPPSGIAAMFGLSVEQARTRVVAQLDPKRDYAASVTVRNLPQAVPFTQLNVVIRGLPHGRPLLTNPSACSPALSITAHVDSWQDPGAYDTATASNEDGEGGVVGITHCASLAFNPELSVGSSVDTPKTPSGMTVSLHLPQEEGADGRAEATLEKATVTLPQGVTISPSAGAGLGACTAAQIQLGNDSPPTCPDDAKVGALRIESPLLAEPLAGPIFIARPWDNPFGSRLAVYAVAEGSGILVKLAGRVDADPATGQLRVSFGGIPQLPFRDLAVKFWDGPRALLSTPSRCGTYTGDSELTAWGATIPVEQPLSLQIASGCSPPRFSPALTAGVSNPVAAEFSSFVLRLQREDLEDEISSATSIDLPRGLAVDLKGTSYCPDSVLAAADVDGAAGSDCPASSRVGSVLVGAGAGSEPLYLDPGAVYLAGPYEGAPLSLEISVPAHVGPFDLGQVGLRAALRIDPSDLHAKLGLDLPTVLAGIPLQIRDVRLQVDRPRFVLNPSSCADAAITAKLGSVGGMNADLSRPFRIGGCGRLGFAPRLSLSFSGAPTRRGGHPRLRAVVRTRRGDANIARLALTMPGTEYLDAAHIRTVCSRARYAAGHCPAGSVYGYAKVWSPLLERPLQGPVYLRSSHRMLPDLAVSLDGQIHADLVGRIESRRGRIRSVFDAAPDVPISRFALTMFGRGKGLLVNNTQLCQARPRAWASFGGQNGRSSGSGLAVWVDCEHS